MGLAALPKKDEAEGEQNWEISHPPNFQPQCFPAVPSFAKMRTHQRSLGDHVSFHGQVCRLFGCQAPSIRTNAIAKNCLFVVILTLQCVPALAGSGMDWGTCCMQAAREQFSEAEPQLPWDACGANPDYNFEDGSEPSPSVKASLGWCKHHCPGYQESSAEQWLQPLSTWVIPALTLLILGSIGESSRDKKNRWPFYTLYYQVREYIALLGDPAGAIYGAFSELWVDTWMVEQMSEAKEASAQVVIGVAMLASQTKCDAFEVPSLAETQPDKAGETDSAESTKEKHTLGSGKEGANSDIKNASTKLRAPAAIQDPVLRSELQRGIRTVLKARADFAHGVIVPVVLLLASTGSSFHDAYLKLGSKDSAHGLAYGIWYSWVIVLAVVSNSYVASVNPGLAKDALGGLVPLSARTVPLRLRAQSAYERKQWTKSSLARSGISTDLKNRPSSFYVGYLFGQAGAWVCIAFVSSCAAAIAYKTPTIGTGCRSFSFLLYGVLAALLTWVSVLRTWADSKNGRNTRMAQILKYLYTCICSLNAFDLVFSTIAQLIGLFRSCFCTHFGPLSSLLELSTGTEQSIHNAAVTWIPVGFVSYSGVWLVCVLAICLRTLNSSRMEKVEWL